VTRDPSLYKPLDYDAQNVQHVANNDESIKNDRSTHE